MPGDFNERYSLVGEDPHKFDLHDGTDQFSIAKGQLPEDFHDLVRSLPPLNKELPPETPDQQAVENPLNKGVDENRGALKDAALDALGVGNGEEGDAIPGTPFQVEREPAKAPAAAPQYQGDLEAVKKPSQGGMQNVSYMPDANSAVNLAKQNGYDLQEKGLRGMFAAQQQEAKAQAIKSQDTIAELGKADEAAKAAYQDFHSQYDAMKQKALEEPNPSRLWQNMSTGNKVTAAISIILGGLSQGLNGGKNPAMEVINDAINKDVEAQKQGLENVHRALGMNLEQTKNQMALDAQLKGSALAKIEAQFQNSAALAKTPQAMAALQLALGDLNIRKETYAKDVAHKTFMDNVTMGGAQQKGEGISPSMRAAALLSAPKDEKEFGERLVRLDDGSPAIARDHGAADKVSEGQVALGNLEDAAREAQRVQAKYHRTNAYLTPTANAESKRAQANLLAATQAVQKLGLRENGVELLTAQAEYPGSFWQDAAASSFQEAINAAQRGKQILYKTYIPSYSKDFALDSEKGKGKPKT